MKHSWLPSQRKGQPVMVCRNQPCRVVWWPDRREPKSTCTGTPYAETAADTVRALIIGGGA